MRRRRALALLCAAAGALLAGSLPFFAMTTAWPEIVTPAWFVSRGLVLYREVFFPHTPLLIGATALAGKLLGFSGGLFRTLSALPLAACGALVVLGVRRRPRAGALAAGLLGAALLAALTVLTEGPALWPEPCIAPFLLGAALALERWDRSGSRRALLGGGLLLGLAVLVKQTSAWAGLAALLWVATAGRRRGARPLGLAALGLALPYALFTVAWAAAFRTLSHLRWTLVYPLFSGHAGEIGVFPSLADLREPLPLFLPIASVALLARALPAARRRSSPAAWIALGAAGMAWPRWGLLHLAGTIGLGALLSARALLLAAAFLRRARRRRTRRARLGLFALGSAAGASAAGAALLAAGTLVWWGGPVHYWDDATTRAALADARAHVPPGGELLVYTAPYETLYPLLRARFPGGVYVNPAFWYYLNKEGLDERLVAILAARPGLPVLYREPPESEKELRATALYRFLNARTKTLSTSGAASWRRVTR